jgi:hypothetical protein
LGKKKLRKKLTSKGQRRKVGKLVARAVKDGRSVLEASLIKVESWAKGQNPWLTIANPDKSQTNKAFIKVRANDYFGPWKVKENKLPGAEA